MRAALENFIARSELQNGIARIPFTLPNESIGVRFRILQFSVVSSILNGNSFLNGERRRISALMRNIATVFLDTFSILIISVCFISSIFSGSARNIFLFLSYRSARPADSKLCAWNVRFYPCRRIKFVCIIFPIRHRNRARISISVKNRRESCNTSSSFRNSLVPSETSRN